MRILRQIISFIRRRDFILNSGTPFERFLILCISFIDSKTNHWAFSYVGEMTMTCYWIIFSLYLAYQAHPCYLLQRDVWLRFCRSQ